LIRKLNHQLSYLCILISITICLCLLAIDAKGQTDAFTEADFSANLWNIEKWTIQAKSNWKRSYGKIDQQRQFNWQRIRSELLVRKNFKRNWALLSGFSYAYQFGSDINNFTERRPWVGINYTLVLNERLSLVQHARGEWRRFFRTNRTNYFRYRYRANLIYSFLNDEGKSNNWFVVASAEWFFLRDPIDEERYPNSNRFTLKGVHRFESSSELGVAVRYEDFFETDFNQTDNAITFLLQYFMVLPSK
jgi:hypothetical protein